MTTASRILHEGHAAFKNGAPCETSFTTKPNLPTALCQPLVRDDLIFDFGLHHGEDSAYYLAKGYRVVAFEADPSSIEFCRRRFHTEVAGGKLRIIEGAITADPAASEVRFYVNRSKPVWSTSNASWVKRNRRWGMRVEEVVAETIDVRSAFLHFGIPHFLKMDIEGVERTILQALQAFGSTPPYLSLESEKKDFDALLDDLELLTKLGYSRFKVVQQFTIPGRRIQTNDRWGRKMTYRFDSHASGGFDEDAEGKWLTLEQTVDLYRKIFSQYRLIGDQSILGRAFAMPLRVVRRATGLPLPGWHDLHAALC